MVEAKIETFIRCCKKKQNLKDLNEFLSEGVNINECGQSGRTPLMEVCRYNADPSLVRFVISKGGNVNARSKYGETALILLGRSQKPCQEVNEVLCELLYHGADINEYDDAGYTGLFNATLNLCNPDIIDVFLEQEADLWQPTHKGVRPADKICFSASKSKYVKKCLENIHDIQYLFYLFMFNKKMANFSDGWSKESVEECIKLFLKQGADINYQNEEGMSALMYFCKNNSTNYVKNIKGCFLERIVHKTNFNTVVEVINILIKNGASTQLKNNQGRTVFDFCNNKEILQALLQTA